MLQHRTMQYFYSPSRSEINRNLFPHIRDENNSSEKVCFRGSGKVSFQNHRTRQCQAGPAAQVVGVQAGTVCERFPLYSSSPNMTFAEGDYSLLLSKSHISPIAQHFFPQDKSPGLYIKLYLLLLQCMTTVSHYFVGSQTSTFVMVWI